MGRPTTANLGATSPRLRAGWTGMLDGTKWNKALRESRLTGREDPDPVTSRLA